MHRATATGYLSSPPCLQEDEEDYQRQFPDQFAAFADLAPDEQPDTLAGASEADASAAAAAAAAAAAGAAGQQPEGEAVGAAALSARELVLGRVLQELVAVHAACFGGGLAASDGAAGGSSSGSEQFLRSYELGTQLLRAVGLVAPAALDAATGSGHLYATACRFRQLSAPALSASAAAAGVDIQAACVEEAVLVQAPVLGLRARLRQLLEEWPEHPGLLQVGGAKSCGGIALVA